MPLALDTQHQFSSIPSPCVSMSSFAPVASVQIGDWDFQLQENTINSAFPELRGFQSPVDTSMSQSSPASIEDPSLQECDLDTLAPPATAVETSRLRRIVPKHGVSSQVIPKATIKLSRRRSKKVGRRQGPLSLKKKEKVSQVRGNACARCFANHLEVR
jgi:hypothetical protein